MKKIFILLICFLFVKICAFTQSDKTLKDSLKCKENIQNYKEDHILYTQFLRTKYIPPQLVNYIERLDRIPFRIAEPGRKFNKTDLIRNKRLPDKRLNLLFNYKDYWVLLFEQGGFAYIQRLIFCKINNQEIVNYCELCVTKIYNQEQLIQFIDRNSVFIADM